MIRDGRDWRDGDGPFWLMAFVVVACTVAILVWLMDDFGSEVFFPSEAWGQEFTQVVPADQPFALSWAPADPSGDVYVVERALGTGPFEELARVQGAGCEDTLGDLEAARYRVRAERTEGLAEPLGGPWSETSARILGVTRPGRPGPPHATSSGGDR